LNQRPMDIYDLTPLQSTAVPTELSKDGKYGACYLI